jgi:choline dehydrogenase
MSKISKIAAFLLFSIASVKSVPIDESEHPHLQARKLLGTSFGIPTLNRTFNYIVVGGGNAGLTVAARLSEDPTKLVAVIEAGSFYELSNGNLSQIPNFDVWWDGKDKNDVNPLVDWGFTTTPQVVSRI